MGVYYASKQSGKFRISPSFAGNPTPPTAFPSLHASFSGFPATQCPAQLFGKPHPPRGHRGQGVPRPVAASFFGLERWREDGRLTSVRSAQRVPPVSLRPVGVRACRALADGRLLSVNGLGVIEQFDYAWRDWQQPAAETAAAVPAAAPVPAEEEAEGFDEDGNGEEQDEVVGGGSDGEPGAAEVKRYVQLRSVCYRAYIRAEFDLRLFGVEPARY